MGNAALLARAAGHEVLGADSGVYPPMSTVLATAAPAGRRVNLLPVGK